METSKRNCCICNNDLEDAEIILDKKDRQDKYVKILDSSGTEVHTVVIVCPDCGLIQTYNPLTEKSLDELYDYNITLGTSRYRQLYPLNDNDLLIHIKSMFDIIHRYGLMNKYKKMLDIGSGSDLVVKVAAEIGYENVDISDKGVESVHNIYSKAVQGSSYDLVTMSNTLEHFYNPLHGLAIAAAHVKDDGTILIIVPDVMNLTVHVSLNAWFSAAHLYHFDWYSILRLVEKSGLFPSFMMDIVEPMGNKIVLGLKKHPHPGFNFKTPLCSLDEVKMKAKYIHILDSLWSMRTEIFRDIERGWKE